MKCIAEAKDKAAAFAFCQERMQADVTIEAPRLKEMSLVMKSYAVWAALLNAD